MPPEWTAPDQQTRRSESTIVVSAGRALLILILASLVGCALATPFQPNANASNTATNTATAAPDVSVNVPATQPQK